MNSSIPKKKLPPVDLQTLKTDGKSFTRDSGANSASVDDFINTPSKTALLEGLHRPTQAEIQGMSDEAVGALNKQEIQALVALLPKRHQDAQGKIILTKRRVIFL
jgi:hypothetical protein